MSQFKAAWQRFRSHFWLSLAFDAFLIMSVFLAVHAWQTRDLPVNEPVPETVLALLDGSGIPPDSLGVMIGRYGPSPVRGKYDLRLTSEIDHGAPLAPPPVIGVCWI